MLTLLRVTFLVLLVTFTALLIVTDSANPRGGQLADWWALAVVGVLLFFGGFIALDMLIPKRKLSTVTAIFVGLIAGVVVTAILGVVIDLFGKVYDFQQKDFLEPFKVMLGMGVCYLTISTVLQTQDDFRLVIPYVEFSKKVRGARPYLVDGSALIDGRLIELAQLGVFHSPLIVPRFVLDELQRLSDSGDKLKRERGRRGLDLLSKLQRSAAADVRVEETPATGLPVDQALIEQARSLPATIITTDHGLARVGVIEGATVLNLHELAAALRPSVIPGDSLQLSVLRRGEQPGQGVGYLDDGTMVVVENGQAHIGTVVVAGVTSAMQTSAGRLIFARVGEGEAQGGNDGRSVGRGEPQRSSRSTDPMADTIPEPEPAAPEVSALDGPVREGSEETMRPDGEPKRAMRSGLGPVPRPASPGRNARNPRRG